MIQRLFGVVIQRKQNYAITLCIQKSNRGEPCFFRDTVQFRKVTALVTFVLVLAKGAATIG